MNKYEDQIPKCYSILLAGHQFSHLNNFIKFMNLKC
jgi:hypothetical protein